MNIVVVCLEILDGTCQDEIAHFFEEQGVTTAETIAESN